MSKAVEQSQYVVLRKLAEIGQPMNMLEIGFSATPSVIRNMAARGMIRVTVAITPRGSEILEKTRVIRLRKETKEQRAARRLAIKVAKAAGGAL